MPSDYYSTLNINRDADQKEVRRAFRKMAKRFHPDKNPGKEGEAIKRFRLILDAYEVLGDVKKRYSYDQSLPKEQPQFRAKPKPKPISEANLILEALLSEEPEAAIAKYERLIRQNPKFSFDDHMNYADSRDCEFLLAEAYQRKNQISKAAFIYESLIEKERKHPHFRDFTDELKTRLKKIYSRHLVKSKSAEKSVVYFQKLLDLGLSKREVAWVYKKLAESYYDMRDVPNACKALELAFKFNPKLTGAKKICQNLGYPFRESHGL